MYSESCLWFWVEWHETVQSPWPKANQESSLHQLHVDMSQIVLSYALVSVVVLSWGNAMTVDMVAVANDVDHG